MAAQSRPLPCLLLGTCVATQQQAGPVQPLASSQLPGILGCSQEAATSLKVAALGSRAVPSVLSAEAADVSWGGQQGRGWGTGVEGVAPSLLQARCWRHAQGQCRPHLDPLGCGGEKSHGPCLCYPAAAAWLPAQCSWSRGWQCG